MAKNPVFHYWTKHIEINVQFVQEQVADILTKSLCHFKFAPNCNKLCIKHIPIGNDETKPP